MKISVNNVKKHTVKTIRCNIDSKKVELNCLHIIAESDDEVIGITFSRAETGDIYYFLKSNGGR